MSNRNLCDWGGWVVGPQHPLPTDDFDFVWPGGVPTRGCNALVCPDCGQRVRNRPGYGPTLDSRNRLAELYDTADWAPLVADGAVSVDRGLRFYLCHCDLVAEDYDRAIRKSSDWPEYDEPTNWHCGGHPRLDLPTTIDGVTIDSHSDFDDLVEGVWLGRLPVAPPSFTKAFPSAWLVRLYHLLQHTPVAEQLAESIGRALTHAESSVRSGAADFFRNEPDAPGSAEIVAALRDHPALFFGLPNPWDTQSTLDRWAQVALSHYVAAGSADAVAVARDIALGPYIPASSLLGALIESDPGWMADHLVDIVATSPQSHVLRDALYHWADTFDDQAVAAVVEVGRAGVLSDETLSTLVSNLVRSPFAERIATELGWSS